MSNYTDNTFSKRESNDAWAKIFDLVPPASRVLDVGCSSGNLGAVLMRDKDCEVVGLDVDKEDVKLAKRRLSAAYVKNIEQDSVSGLGLFDCIVMADVIEHLQDPIGALRKAGTILKKNGTLVFSIPNMAHVSVRLMLMRGHFTYTETGLLDKTHLHFYDENEVARVFSEAGFKIEKLTPAIKDFPDYAVEEQLKKLGLVSGEGFYKKLRSTNGMVYQYIGAAKKRSVKAGTKTGRPALTNTQISDELTRDVERKHRQAQVHIRNLEAQTSNLEAEIEAIKNSQTFKLAKKLGKARNFYK